MNVSLLAFVAFHVDLEMYFVMINLFVFVCFSEEKGV